MSDHATQIKSMKLYTHIERVKRELAEIGKHDSSKLDAAEINGFDQLHYHGTQAVDFGIQMTGINKESKVLEIGSGFGGCARHMAVAAGANVTALELQADQNQLASELTERCGLADKIEHVCGDFLQYPWDEQRFDNIVSWLAIFHIPDRDKLLRISMQLLQPGGAFFAEDMYALPAMDAQGREELGTGMYASYLPDFAKYQQDFHDAGFELEQVDEMSEDWTEFTTQRLSDYRQSRERQIRVHGESAYNALEEFYDLVNRHFVSGKLGGVRILARTPD